MANWSYHILYFQGVTILRNKFTALALIIIAIFSASGESSAEKEQSAEAAGETVKSETFIDVSEDETVPEESVTEVSETEPEDENM